MKAIPLFLLFPFFFSGIETRTTVPECEYKGKFTTNDIDVVGSLEAKVTSQVQIPIENEGSCTWKKNEVYMQVLFYAGPRGTDKSECYTIFKTRAKHQMNTDNITPGRAAKFVIRFDPVEVEGTYRLGFSLIGKNGKVVCGPITKNLSYND
ncbi:MAG: hypothetical protein ACT4OJ_03355 [Bacteroidota bacterium]